MLGVVSSTLALGCLAALCVGQPDPFQAVVGDCRKFSSDGHNYTCPTGYAFSSLIKFCVPKKSFLNNQCIDMKEEPNFREMCDMCTMVSQGRFECVYLSPYDCSKFINCSKSVDDDETDNLPVLADECYYPDLFDAVLNRCAHYNSGLDCGDRFEPKEPCEYARNMCGRSSHCRPCWARHASCKDKRDGTQGWVGREWSPYFAKCQNQRTLYSGTCTTSKSGQPRIFSPDTNRCDDLDLIPRVFGGFRED